MLCVVERDPFARETLMRETVRKATEDCAWCGTKRPTMYAYHCAAR